MQGQCAECGKNNDNNNNHNHSARDIISLDRRLGLKVARNFGRKTRRLSDDVVPIGEPGPRDGREEPGKGTGAGVEVESGTRTRMGTGMRTVMEMGMGAVTGTRMKRRVEGKQSLGTCEVIADVGRKTEKGVTPTSNQQPQ